MSLGSVRNNKRIITNGLRTNLADAAQSVAQLNQIGVEITSWRHLHLGVVLLGADADARNRFRVPARNEIEKRREQHVGDACLVS